MTRQHFDSLDLRILRSLSNNARTPYLEIAREAGVSGAAVHQRVQRLIGNNVIVGSQCLVEPSSVGFNVVAYLGIKALASADIEELVEGLKGIEEITECHIVAGRYDIICKLHASDNFSMLELIRERMRPLKIASTETLVSFREAFHRGIPIDNR